MFSKLVRLAVRFYGLLLAVACGGFLGANLAGFVPGIREFFFNPEARATLPETYRRWMHGGWVVGAGFAIVAGLLELRGRRSARRAVNQEHGRDAPRHSYPVPRSFLGAIAAGAAGFGLLGAMLGGTFLLLWFSLTYSPFSPAGWGSSVAVETEPMVPSRQVPRGLAVHTTDHPVALYLFVVPTLMGLAVERC